MSANLWRYGIDQGQSFEIVTPETFALGVDPNPCVRKALKPNQRVFAETSDDFFNNHDLIAELGGKTLELAFIDGMHQFEFALQDFFKVEIGNRSVSRTQKFKGLLQCCA